MPSKKQKQIENKKRHRGQLKLKRKPALDLTRRAPTKLEKPLFLIVCEGRNTEKSYFDQDDGRWTMEAV